MKMTRTTFLMGALGLGLAPKVRARSGIVFDLLPVGAPSQFVSANGRVTLGGNGATIKRWQFGSGVTTFSTGVSVASELKGASRGGDAVVFGGYLWQESTGAVALTVPAGCTHAYAWAVSRDKSKVAGYALKDGLSVSYLWENGDPTEIGVLPEYQSGGITDISKDGNAITGMCSNQWNSQAFYGTPGITNSIMLPGYWHTMPYAISDDGQTVVGIAYSEDWHTISGFVWTKPSSGTQSDATLVGSAATTAIDVSEDGSVIVGRSNTGEGYFWNGTLGVTLLKTYLLAHNVGLKGADFLLEITRVSADGTTMIGTTTKDGVPRTFRARHPYGWQNAL